MKRIRPLRGLARWGGGLLAWGMVVVGRPASAQVAPGSRAQLYRVPATGEAARFQVPQVRLPNAAVARRINRQLLQFAIDDETSAVDSTASPQRQLRQAARICCYDEESKTWLAAGNGQTATSYQVLLNQNYLLSVEFQYAYGGLSEPETHHLTFDLRTGRVLTLADLVADSPAQLSRRLAAAVGRRLHEELAEVAASYGDSDTIARVAMLYGYGDAPWDTTPRRDRTLAAPSGDDGRFPIEFAIRPDALLLFHPVGMARVDFEFLPDERYVFPFKRLHPRGLLVPLAASGQRKRAK